MPSMNPWPREGYQASGWGGATTGRTKKWLNAFLGTSRERYRTKVVSPGQSIV
jgi:hypothetical protein